MNYIVTVSPKGQITIPVAERKNLRYDKFLLQRKNNTFILNPVEISVVGAGDDLKGFHHLSEGAFDFWNDPSEDIWDEFYASSDT